MNILTSTIFIFVLAVSTGLLKAQTVVLLNGVPTKVVLEGTRIVSISDEVVSHMGGYATAETKIQYADNPDFIGVTASESINLPTVSAPIASESVTTIARPDPIEEKPAKMKPAKMKPANDKFLAGNYFNFSGNSALLSEAAISEIKEYAGKITSGEATNVLLESFFEANNVKSEELVQNRLDGCKKYFEVNGVASNIIKINIIADKTQSNKVSIRLN